MKSYWKLDRPDSEANLASLTNSKTHAFVLWNEYKQKIQVKKKNVKIVTSVLLRYFISDELDPSCFCCRTYCISQPRKAHLIINKVYFWSNVLTQEGVRRGVIFEQFFSKTSVFWGGKHCIYSRSRRGATLFGKCLCICCIRVQRNGVLSGITEARVVFKCWRDLRQERKQMPEILILNNFCVNCSQPSRGETPPKNGWRRMC